LNKIQFPTAFLKAFQSFLNLLNLILFACVAQIDYMKSLSASLSVVALLPEPLGIDATLVNPIPYTSFASNSYAHALFDCFDVEDLEDSSLSASGDPALHGMAPRSAGLPDLVVEDASSILESGASGRTWYFNGVSSITFTFGAALLGALPTHAGMVWTNLGLANVRKGFDSVLFEAFDTMNNSVGLVGPSAFGDGLFAGQTVEDRFFGITSASGIGSVRISLLNSTQQGLDNLQYDFSRFTQSVADSDPAVTLAVLVVGCAGDGFTRRRLHS